MANIIKILRSLTAGVRPSGRTYGEPYVNLSDNQIGVFDSSNVARDLVGVPFFSTSTSYTAGRAVNQGGLLYVALTSIAPGAFNPAQWTLVATQSWASSQPLPTLHNFVTNVAGSYTFTTPSNSTTLTVYRFRMVGGGGGGAGTSSVIQASGGGGAGGGFAEGLFSGVAPNTGIPITIGPGGNGGGPNVNGGIGGDSTIGSPVNVTCSGGTGGGSSSTTFVGPGGTGGGISGPGSGNLILASNGQAGWPGVGGMTDGSFGGGGDGGGTEMGRGGIGAKAGISYNALTNATGYGSGGGGGFGTSGTGSNGLKGFVRIDWVL
jgi:hypothetical protein